MLIDVLRAFGSQMIHRNPKFLLFTTTIRIHNTHDIHPTSHSRHNIKTNVSHHWIKRLIAPMRILDTTQGGFSQLLMFLVVASDRNRNQRLKSAVEQLAGRSEHHHTHMPYHVSCVLLSIDHVLTWSIILFALFVSITDMFRLSCRVSLSRWHYVP